jgi:HAD superfamily hydrolase (TIGR01490 family)
MDAKRPAALFDFDGTLTARDTMGPFLLFLLRTYPACWLGLPRPALLAAPYAAGLVSKEAIKGAAMRIWRKVRPQDREELLRRFHDQELKPRYLPKGVERVRWHHAQGHTLALVSASVDVYLGEVVRELGFDHLVATRTTLEPAPAVVGPNNYGEEKVARLKQLPLFLSTDWAASYGYSDHLSDLPMLRLCGHPVAANPKPDLLQVARVEGWEIVDWR